MVGKYRVGTIGECIRLSKHTARKGSTLALKAKEERDKVNSRALTEKAAIKAELQYSIALVKKTDQGQIGPTESLKI